MITIYVGQRGGRIKLTSDKDCLAPDVIRVTGRTFVNMEQVKTAAAGYENRGFRVCIDTEDCFYETPDDMFRKDA